MKAVIVTHSSTYESRAEAVAGFFRQRGDEAQLVVSDFDHLTGKTKTPEADRICVHMRPYRAHLSPGRLMSISRFAKDAERVLEGMEFDLLYVLVPANSLLAAADRLKKRKNILVAADIIDLWPESLPLSGVGKLPPVLYWKGLRDRHLSCADAVFTECAYYRDFLPLPAGRAHTLYWFREGSGALLQTPPAPEGPLQIAYIGAINHIIDIPLICLLLEEIGKRVPVTLQVIGDGERREELLRALDEKEIVYRWHGAVYNENGKKEVLSACRFGLNLMRSGVRVGLTMKSLEYISCGLPLINNIPGDTREMVERCGAGINLDAGSPQDADVLRKACAAAAEEILQITRDEERWQQMRRRTLSMFREHFTRSAFTEELRQGLRDILPQDKGTDGN